MACRCDSRRADTDSGRSTTAHDVDGNGVSVQHPEHGCVRCLLADLGDEIAFRRYARRSGERVCAETHDGPSSVLGLLACGAVL